jgi:hypothetical protein
MQLVASRTYQFLDASTLDEGCGQESLLRTEDGALVLYLVDRVGLLSAQERLIPMDLRDALVWINQSPDEATSFWD